MSDMKYRPQKKFYVALLTTKNNIMIRIHSKRSRNKRRTTTVTTAVMLMCFKIQQVSFQKYITSDHVTGPSSSCELHILIINKTVD